MKQTPSYDQYRHMSSTERDLVDESTRRAYDEREAPEKLATARAEKAFFDAATGGSTQMSPAQESFVKVFGMILTAPITLIVMMMIGAVMRPVGNLVVMIVAAGLYLVWDAIATTYDLDYIIKWAVVFLISAGMVFTATPLADRCEIWLRTKILHHRALAFTFLLPPLGCAAIYHALGIMAQVDSPASFLGWSALIIWILSGVSGIWCTLQGFSGTLKVPSPPAS